MQTKPGHYGMLSLDDLPSDEATAICSTHQVQARHQSRQRKANHTTTDRVVLEQFSKAIIKIKLQKPPGHLEK